MTKVNPTNKDLLEILQNMPPERLEDPVEIYDCTTGHVMTVHHIKVTTAETLRYYHPDVEADHLYMCI